MFNSCVNYLEEQASKNSEKIALTDKNGSITFREMRVKAIEIASAIGSQYRNQPVGVYLPKSINCITSYMAVLYTGNFYVPLDVKSPEDRINTILGNLNPAVIVTESKYAKKFSHNPSYEGIKIVTIDNISEENKEVGFDYKSIISSVLETDPIYCIYTSGSTGVPKGVLVSHLNIDNFATWVQGTYDVNQDTIIGNQCPFMFDVSGVDIYMCMKYGAHVHIIPETLFSFPVKLVDFLNEKRINFIIWVPSVLIHIANSKAFDKNKPEFLEKVLFIGEPMPNKQLNYWRSHLPNTLFSNTYGPTEATIITSYYNVDRPFKDSDPLPLGKPCYNAEMFVLSDQGKLIQNDQVGELYIKGTLVALGYWNNSKATKGAFIQNPLNQQYPETVYKTGDLVTYNEFNEIVYVGRVDSQIKHLGYRIELGEIENAVGNIKSIYRACVLYNKTDSEIVLFFDTDDSNLNDGTIRKDLSKYIPKYMLPSKFIRLKDWPLNSNGKVDRKKLTLDYLS